MRRGIAILALLLAFASPASALDWLEVRGRLVVRRDSGEAVRLRGVCLDRFYFSYEEDPGVVATYCRREDVSQLAAEGVTLVRLGFHWREVLGPESARDLKRLDEIVSWCRENGIYVVLDLRLPPGNREIDPIDGAFWEKEENATDLLRLWKVLAGRYAAEPAVLGYDVFNEPVPPDPERWWSLAERLIEAIRSVDPRHIVVIEPPLVDDQALRKLPDPQVLYSVHFYEPMMLSHQGAWWLGDVPLPMDLEYPGVVPTVEELGYGDGASLEAEDAAKWRRLGSAEEEAPAGACWLALTLYAEGEVEGAWFDDLEVTCDGQPVAVPNPGFEERSEQAEDLPRIWRPGGEGDGEGTWSGEAHSGTHCVKLEKVASRRSWTNWNDAIAGYYVAVSGGKKYRASAWVRTLRNRGSVGIGLAWLGRGEERWDRARVELAMKPVLEWGERNEAPLYFGEIGATRGNRKAGAAYVADVIAVLNAAQAPWTLWCFRDPSEEAKAGAFGLWYGKDRGGTSGCTQNRELWEVVRAGLK